MGTRSVVAVMGANGEVAASIYRQMDGYPSGMGKELCDFLAGRRIGNGIGRGEDGRFFSNGMGDLAAQLVAWLKGPEFRPGGIYLFPPFEGMPDFMGPHDGEFEERISGWAKGNAESCWAEYSYAIWMKDGEPMIICADGEGKILFDGCPADMGEALDFEIDSLPEQGMLDHYRAWWLARNVAFSGIEEFIKSYDASRFTDITDYAESKGVKPGLALPGRQEMLADTRFMEDMKNGVPWVDEKDTADAFLHSSPVNAVRMAKIANSLTWSQLGDVVNLYHSRRDADENFSEWMGRPENIRSVNDICGRHGAYFGSWPQEDEDAKPGARASMKNPRRKSSIGPA